MDPFNFHKMFQGMNPNHSFSPDYLKDIRGMVDEYKQVLDEDFWNSVNGMGRRKKTFYNQLPIEIWDNETNLFLLVFVPGLTDANDVKLTFLSESRILLKANVKRPQPPTSTKLVESDFNDEVLQRELDFPYPIHKDNYHVYVEESMATFIFKKSKKRNKEESIPIDF
ncbi:hypothetical protein KO561_06300 [Radiobacillus kanasensis]|uniref:hypothetical protein n=1 Tax=Radiobacillus kanasensis TaxID=2844358 RepID=UPI001E39A222|nr:hypothetical protein [Radiobacillus kanasensis]UFU00550.1 hypothetical protein KO561_06300 [Radiobacillus kanasensis]